MAAWGRFVLVVVALSASLLIPPSGQAQITIDSERSTMTVHVFKSGLFSAFGHEHEISAPVRGSFTENPASAEVSRGEQGKWIVQGDLTLHGQTKPVKIDVEKREARYRARAELKQKDLGITPVTVGGGTVKVKNELRVEFDIVAKAQ